MSGWITIGRARLICADCRDVLPTLGKVDAVVTDPPYGEVNRASNGLRNLDKGAADVADFDLRELAALLVAVGRSVYVWCGIEQVSELRRAMVDANMSTRACVWEKTNPSPMNGQYLWLSSVELCVFGKEAGAPYFGHCASPVWRIPVETGQVHPTQKPVTLMKHQIAASVAANGCVLDPFMGSGTTGVAAVQMGRDFIGIERERRYFDIACRRIEEAQRQGRLCFDAEPSA